MKTTTIKKYDFKAKTAIPDSVVVDVPQYPPVPVSDQLKKI